ncbi:MULTISPECIES: hypothetical protein [unclassified Massilia]|uniref:hypothetical protein n=1 Tax=unclassified Massilia TaxID=2609279 RepID=UPI00177E0046|nr:MULTISPECIES: hypothetical protein [unclassified Massilia]MBD8531590.1 hypothetical protein [Massilia sp. CFBP 13647]MBD8673614.1 hypothetical protein [Massilia sp. CFBP 13721]
MPSLRHLQLSVAPAAGRCACALVVAVLAGCTSSPLPKISVPVAVGCVGAVPARPVSTFGAGTYPGDKAAAQAALIDAAAWEGYATKLEVVIAGCSRTVEKVKGV